MIKSFSKISAVFILLAGVWFLLSGPVQVNAAAECVWYSASSTDPYNMQNYDNWHGSCGDPLTFPWGSPINFTFYGTTNTSANNSGDLNLSYLRLKSGYSGTVTLNSGNITVDSAVDIDSGIVNLLGGQLSTIGYSDFIVNGGTFDSTGGVANVFLSTSFTPASRTLGGSGNVNFYSLTISNEGNHILAGNITTTNFTNNGDFDFFDYDLVVLGDYINNGRVFSTGAMPGKIIKEASGGFDSAPYNTDTDSVIISITDPTANFISSTIETIYVTITTTDGGTGSDIENITLTETSASSGIFDNSVTPVVFDIINPVSSPMTDYDGVLNVVSNTGNLYLSYTNGFGVFTSMAGFGPSIPKPNDQDEVFSISLEVDHSSSVSVTSTAATNTIWFAPATLEFTQAEQFVVSATMTVASGTATSISSPSTAGFYRVYLVNEDTGMVSDPSKAILSVKPYNQNITLPSSTSSASGEMFPINGNSSEIINGVTFLAILVPINTDNPFAYIMGNLPDFNSGQMVSNTVSFDSLPPFSYNSETYQMQAPYSAQDYNIYIAAFIMGESGPEAYVLSNSSTAILTVTGLNLQNDVFTASTSVTKETSKMPSISINSSGNELNQVWFAPPGMATILDFVAGETMTQAQSGLSTQLRAPITTGTYHLYVIDPYENVSSPSDAILTVLPSASNYIDSFSLSIDNVNYFGITSGTNINVYVPTGSDLSSVTPTFKISDFATVEPESDVLQDFFNPVVYTVTAENGDQREYTVIVFEAGVQNFVFPGPVRVGSSGYVSINPSLNVSNSVWFAPAGLTDPTEFYIDGSTMTKAENGSFSFLYAPSLEGHYKLYVLTPSPEFPDIDCNNDHATCFVSDPSNATLTVDATPPTIEILGDNPAYIYQGESLTNTGIEVDAGTIVWDLIDGVSTTIDVEVARGGDYIDSSVTGTYSIGYETWDEAGNWSGVFWREVNVIDRPLLQDQVFPDYTTVNGGSNVSINSSGDVNNEIWFAPSTTLFTSVEEFVQSATMTMAVGDAIEIIAPTQPGFYRLYVISEEGIVSAPSLALLGVKPENNALFSSSTIVQAVGGVVSFAPNLAIYDEYIMVGGFFAPEEYKDDLEALFKGFPDIGEGETSADRVSAVFPYTASSTTTTVPFLAGEYKFFVLLATEGGEGEGPGAVALSDPSDATLTVTGPTNQNLIFTESTSTYNYVNLVLVSDPSVNEKMQFWFAPAGMVSSSDFIQDGPTTSLGMLGPMGDQINFNFNIATGTYYFYVIDEYGNVSEASTSTLTILPSANNSIRNFYFYFSTSYFTGDILGVIDETATPSPTIKVYIPNDPEIDVTHLSPSISFPKGTNSTVSPEEGVEQDFTNPVVYTVTAESGDIKQYIVTVEIEEDIENLVLPAFKTVYPENRWININSSGNFDNQVWLAPAGLTSTEQFDLNGVTTTKTDNGQNTGMDAPGRVGEYFVYVINNVGDIFGPSDASVTVTKTLKQNEFLPVSTSSLPGENVAITIPIEGWVGNAWFAPEGMTSVEQFVEDDYMTKGGWKEDYVIKAPNKAGNYRLYVVDDILYGNVSDPSNAILTVLGPDNQDEVFPNSTSTIRTGGDILININPVGLPYSNVWFAPAGLTSSVQFEESLNMRNFYQGDDGMGGQAWAPIATGTYHLYIIDKNNNVSDQSLATWTILSSNSTNIDNFGFTVSSTYYKCNISDANINCYLPLGTDRGSLTPEIQLSKYLSTTIYPENDGLPKDFTNPQIYTVTAEDEVTTKEYTVSVFTAEIQDVVFPVSKIISGGNWVEINSSGNADNNVWFAPDGLTTQEQFYECATMTKAYDGTYTGMNVPSDEGIYYIYIVDIVGNVSTHSIASLTVDNTPPVISLIGEATTTVYQNSNYVDAGATAIDDIDGDVSSDIVRSAKLPEGYINFVNTNNTGTFYIVYQVCDTAGNCADANLREINVINSPAPTDQNELFTVSSTVEWYSIIPLTTSTASENFIWFAPYSVSYTTSSFAVSATMTMAVGTSTTIEAPDISGAYRLYVINNETGVSEPSDAILFVRPYNQDTVFPLDTTSEKTGDTVQIVINPSGLPNSHIWFATSTELTSADQFAKGDYMRVSDDEFGTSTLVDVPFGTGIYYLYLIDQYDNVSDPSIATLTVVSSSNNNIKNFSIYLPTEGTIYGTINEGITSTIDIRVSTGTVVTSLTPSIELESSLATINPESDVSQNFTNSVNYTVTAENGTQKVYIVNIAPYADMTELNAEIATATAMYNVAVTGTLPGQYTTSSKNTFLSAIQIAEGYTSTSLQSEVDGAVLNLQQAESDFIDSVIPLSDMSALDAKIAIATSTYDTAVEGDIPIVHYVSGSKAIFLPEIETAQSYTNTSSQATIDQAVIDLQDAIDNFEASKVGLSDVSALDTKIAVATSTYDAAVEGDIPLINYIAGSKTTFNIAIVHAQGVTNTSSQSTVDAEVTTLQGAIDIFEASKVPLSNTSSLDAKIATATIIYGSAVEGTLPGQYAVGSKTTLNTAIVHAQGVTNTSSQATVDAEVITLQNAIDTFEAGKVGPDTTPPVITKIGEDMKIYVGTVYTDFGATAYDAVYGTTTVDVTNPVNTNVTGTYYVVYSATDGSSNTASTTRTVWVLSVGSDEQNLTTSTQGNTTTPIILIGDNSTATSTVTVSDSITTTIYLDISATSATSTTSTVGAIPGSITVNVSTTIGIVQVTFPAGMTVTTPTSTWNGTISLPIIEATSSVSVTPDSGYSATVNTVISLGFGDTALNFDKAVRILMPGKSGYLAGYYRGTTFTKITATCSADTQVVGDALSAGGDCRINVGSDLVIWTKHFTDYIAYTQTYVGGGGGGGGGGGSTPIVVVAPVLTIPTVGRNPVVINGGALITKERAVSVSFNVANATEMVVSEKSSFIDTTWEKYAITKSFTLSSNNGRKTIYAMFRSSNGGMTNTYLSSITYSPDAVSTSTFAVGDTCSILAPGDMIKVEGKPAIYVLDNNMNYRYFSDGDVFKSWNADDNYSKYYKSITQSCFDSLSQPMEAPYHVFYRPGSEVVKYLSSDKLYVVGLNSTLYPITLSAAKTIFGDKFKAKTIGLSEWPYYVKSSESITQATVYPGMLAKIGGRNYFVDEDKTLREITALGMLENNIKTSYVRTLPSTIMSGFALGETIISKILAYTSRIGF